MDKTITTAILIVVSMIMAIALFNVAYPAVLQGGDAIVSMANRAEDRMRSQIKIIHAASELDSGSGWQDSNGNGDFEVFVWVKNVGAARIIALESMDIFFGPEGNFARIPHESNTGGATPYWSWQIENEAQWVPTGTLKIIIHYSFPLTSGRYYFKAVAPSGVEDSYFLGI